MALVSGAHVILYSTDADADRAFLPDGLAFPSVDARRGWLMFALPSGARLGVSQPKHPTAGSLGRPS